MKRAPVCKQSSYNHTLYLQRHADPAGHLSDDGGGDGGGGVALVAVELDHWALREKHQIGSDSWTVLSITNSGKTTCEPCGKLGGGSPHASP